jgi:hypothetical protein
VRVFALILVNLAATVLLTEVALRFVPIPGYSNYIDVIRMLKGQSDSYRGDPEGGMSVLLPNRTFTWTIMDGKFDITTIPFPDNNSLGMRDDGLNAAAPRKVFACGDSFTFGFGVDNGDVWHEVLEDKYANEVDIFSLRGIGASVPGILAKYAHYRNRFEHDTVFLGIYLGNEFTEAYGQASRPVAATDAAAQAIGGEIPSEQGLNFTGRVYSFLRHHSYTARLVKYLFFKRLIRFGYYNYDVKREVYQPEGSPFVFTIDYEQDILVRTCELEYSPRMQAGTESFAESVDALSQMIEEDGRQVFAFIFPFKEQVYWEQWAFRLEHPERYDRLKPNHIVREALERANVRYYDLTDDLTEAGRTQVLYWPIDSHWNPAGNRLAAVLIHTWLAEHGFPGDEL